MSVWVYMLRCADGTFYTGQTSDVAHRIDEHQAGVGSGYTFSRRPVELVWCEEFAEPAQALQAELIVKGWPHVKKKTFIAGDMKQPKLAAIPLSERSSSQPPPPAIVLVRPQLAENIGKAARAMLNFGLTDLRLVSPRDGWPNPDAGPAASGADHVIAGARLFDSVADAVADCAHVYATTVRKRGVTKPVVTPEAAAANIRSAPERSAILFGPERAGLETGDVALARTILTVPINPAFGSLNLAQAVILVAYEWSKGEALVQPPLVDAEPPARQADLEGLIVQVNDALAAAGFYFPPAKVPMTKRVIRSILTRPGWSAGEVRTLRGAIAALVTPRPKG